MALRDQPYIPLYVQDLLTDEKLMECSASAHGVYFRLICILHKQEEYGVILLKQKDKQTDKQIKNFALKLAKPLPFDLLIIENSLNELVSEQVLHIEGDKLVQKRMRKDGLISDKRSKSGSEGGKSTQSKVKKDTSFAKAKSEANSKQNTEIEYEDESDNEIELNIMFAEKKEELINLLVDVWGFSEQKYSQQKSMVFAFVTTQLKSIEDINHFAEQYKNYDAYKKLSGEQRHNSIGYFGSQKEQFSNGAWNSENWGLKLEQYKANNNNKTKFDKLQDAFNAPNPYSK
jgi:hypothetical protein